MCIYGIGRSYDPQRIAEIGGILRFTHKETSTAFADIDSSVNQLDPYNSKSNRVSKVGSVGARKTPLDIMTVLLLKLIIPIAFFSPLMWLTFLYFKSKISYKIFRWFM